MSDLRLKLSLGVVANSAHAAQNASPKQANFSAMAKDADVVASSFEKISVRRKSLALDAKQLREKNRAPFQVSSPLNVAVLCLGGMGGSAKVAREAAQCMAESGHRLHLLSSAQSFWASETSSEVKHAAIGIPEGPTEPSSSWLDPLKDEIKAYVKAHQIDILNVHYVTGVIEAVVAARDELVAEGVQVKVSAMLHGTDVTHWGQDKKHRSRTADALKRCDELTAVSECLAAQALEAFGVEASVIANAVDLHTFSPAQWRTQIRRKIAPNGELVMCHVSNLREVKRPLDAVRTLDRVRKEGQPAKLLLVGDGPMLEAVAELAESLGVDEHIVPVGRQEPDRLAKFVAASDVMLVTSEAESFSLAAVEAMACGVPVVGTHCGGLDEVMRWVDAGPDGQSRLLSNIGDYESMALKVVGLVEDKSRYQRIQKQCLRVPIERYPRERQHAGYLTMLEDLRCSLDKTPS